MIEATKTATTIAEQARREISSLRIQTGLETQSQQTQLDQRRAEEKAARQRQIDAIKETLSAAGTFSKGKAIEDALRLLQQLS